jgi:hypothetical protein
MLPAYVQHVAHALLRNGHAATEGQAIAMARGIIRDWQEGHLQGHKHYHVHGDVRAAAAKASAEWDAKRARAHAQAASHGDYSRTGGSMSTIDLARRKAKNPSKNESDKPDEEPLSEGETLASAYHDSVATLGADHPHTKDLKAALDKHLAGKGSEHAQLKSHLTDVHRLPEDAASGTLDQLHSKHVADHKKHPTLKHVHSRGISSKPKAAASESYFSTEYGEQVHFDERGQRIDLAIAASKSHSHRSRYAAERGDDVEPITVGGKSQDLHPTEMTPEQLHTHLSNSHSVTVNTHGAPSIQDVETMRKMHAACHPNSYDLATTTVEYPTGTKVHHHSKSGSGGTTKVGRDGKAKSRTGSRASDKKGTYVGFEKLVQRIMAKGKSRKDAEAIAASIGRAKYGAGKFQKAAASGHKLSNEVGGVIDLRFGTRLGADIGRRVITDVPLRVGLDVGRRVVGSPLRVAKDATKDATKSAKASQKAASDSSSSSSDSTDEESGTEDAREATENATAATRLSTAQLANQAESQRVLAGLRSGTTGTSSSRGGSAQVHPGDIYQASIAPKPKRITSLSTEYGVPVHVDARVDLARATNEASAVPDTLKNHPGFKKLVKRIKAKGKTQEEAETIAMKLAKNWGVAKGAKS